MSAADSSKSLLEKNIGQIQNSLPIFFLLLILQGKLLRKRLQWQPLRRPPYFLCLLVPGRPRISTGVFLCRQSELFLAFRTNHSYSRIVDKKTRHKSKETKVNVLRYPVLPTASKDKLGGLNRSKHWFLGGCGCQGMTCLTEKQEQQR